MPLRPPSIYHLVLSLYHQTPKVMISLFRSSGYSRLGAAQAQLERAGDSQPGSEQILDRESSYDASRSHRWYNKNRKLLRGVFPTLLIISVLVNMYLVRGIYYDLFSTTCQDAFKSIYCKSNL